MNDDRIFAFGIISNHFGPGADINAASTCAVSLNNPSAPSNNSAGGKVWTGNVANQIIYCDFRVFHDRKTARHHFTHVVRGNIRCHTNRDTR